MILTEKTADAKVARLQQQGLDIEWDGWNLVSYKPFEGAYMRKNGAFRNGEWQLKRVYELNDDGKWYIPNVRFKK